MEKISIYNIKALIYTLIFFLITDIYFVYIGNYIGVFIFQFFIVLLLLLFDTRITRIDDKFVNIKYLLVFRNKHINKNEVKSINFEFITKGRDTGVYLYLYTDKSKHLIKQWISFNEANLLIDKLNRLNYIVEFKGLKIVNDKFVTHLK
jgi:hypothetical protein